MGTQVCLPTRLKPHKRRDDQVHLCSLPGAQKTGWHNKHLTIDKSKHRTPKARVYWTLLGSTHCPKTSKCTHEPIFNSQGLPSAPVNCQQIPPRIFFRVLNSSPLQRTLDLYKCYVWGSSDIRENSLRILSVYLWGMFEATPPQKIRGLLSLTRFQIPWKKEANAGKRKKLQGHQKKVKQEGQPLTFLWVFGSTTSSKGTY